LREIDFPHFGQVIGTLKSKEAPVRGLSSLFWLSGQ